MGRPRPRYSNFGFELLGHAVAAAAGTKYVTMVHDRLVVPLELNDRYVPAATPELRPLAVAGRTRAADRARRGPVKALGPAGASARVSKTWRS